MEFTIDIDDGRLADALNVSEDEVEEAFEQLDDEDIAAILVDRVISYAAKHASEVEVSGYDSGYDDEDDDY